MPGAGYLVGVIRTVQELHDADTARFGGKAVALGRLVRRGLPVPPAVAVSADALDAFLADAGLADRAQRLCASAVDADALERLRADIQAAPLSPALTRALADATATLGPHLAVRSSGAEEDGAERSFAGQYLSLLNVPPGVPCHDALRACWASLFTPSALGYRGPQPRPPAMGVVVQTLVDAAVAGVVFTMNPVNGSYGELVVEAVWGQGEALVGGHVSPDRYLVRRPRRLPRGLGRVWDRIQVRELQVDLVAQPKALRPGPPGELSWQPTERSGRTLSPRQVQRLSRMALRAERHAGVPQDLEFALDGDGGLFVLQARPITTAPEPRRGNEEVLWTRRFIGERWPGLASPLGWSISSELLTWFVDYPQTSAVFLGGEAPLRLLRGRPYVNVSIFRHLAFKLPGRPPPSFMMDFLPPEEVERWNRRFAYPPDTAVYRSVFRTTFAEQRWRRFRWNPWTNHRAWDAFRDGLAERLDSIERPNDTVRARLSRVERAVEIQRDYLRIHVCSLLFANLGYEIVRGLVPPELFDHVMTTAENPTVAVNQALYDLAQGTLSLETFLERYGHRSTSASWELFTTRWAEDPAQIEPLVEPFRGGRLPNPALRARERVDASNAALARLEHETPPADLAWVMGWVRLARRYLELREEQRFHFDRIVWALKRAVLELGALLLDDPHDMQWLEWGEVQALANGQLPDAQSRIDARRAQWAVFAAEPAPPVFLAGDRGLEHVAQGRRLQGLGISPGRVTGTVRVVRSMDQADRLGPGDVLVAVATDPGWTPLFPIASAVVLELGSMLSHGAVVAREYQLPAVVNVSQATSILRDGQRVTVDGGRGLVWIEDESE